MSQKRLDPTKHRKKAQLLRHLYFWTKLTLGNQDDCIGAHLDTSRSILRYSSFLLRANDDNRFRQGSF